MRSARPSGRRNPLQPPSNEPLAACNCGGNHSAIVGFDGPGNGHAVTCPVRTAATVSRRFKVVVCGDCKCQVRMLPDEGWQCSCCGVISEDDAHEIVVTAEVPLALIEAATS